MSEGGRDIRILIADDHTIFREGLKSLFESESGFLVVGEARDGKETIKMMKILEPDVLLLDMSMPKTDGMEVMRTIAKSDTRAQTILLTAEIKGEQISEAFRLGARGLVMKESAASVLYKSIRCVMKGKYWIGTESYDNPAEILSGFNERTAKRLRQKQYGLSARELDIVGAVAAGYTNKEIAARFRLSEQTVKHHLSNVFDKLGVYNRVELALFALHHGLIDSA